MDSRYTGGRTDGALYTHRHNNTQQRKDSKEKHRPGRSAKDHWQGWGGEGTKILFCTLYFYHLTIYDLFAEKATSDIFAPIVPLLNYNRKRQASKAESRARVGRPQTSKSPPPRPPAPRPPPPPPPPPSNFYCWPSQGGSSVLVLW